MLEVMQNNIEVNDGARCKLDKEKRSPLHMEECPNGCEMCDADCMHYTEDPRIVINVTGSDLISRMYTYPTIEDLKAEWHAKDDPIVPKLTDRLLCGEVDDEEVHGDTAKAVFDVLKEKYGWNYSQLPHLT